jgi:20S proteasome alpha/beta subunit
MSDSDSSVTTFSQAGKLSQIDSAFKALSLGRQSVGVKAKNHSRYRHFQDAKPISKSSGSLQKGCVFSGVVTRMDARDREVRGVSLLIIGWEDTSTLWQVHPAGIFWARKGTALGK